MRRGIALGITVGVALMILSAYGSASGSARIEAARNVLPDCGWTLEAGESAEDRCALGSQALAQCAITNGAALSLEDCLSYLAWMDATEHCRAMDYQAQAEACLEREGR